MSDTGIIIAPAYANKKHIPLVLAKVLIGCLKSWCILGAWTTRGREKINSYQFSFVQYFEQINRESMDIFYRKIDRRINLYLGEACLEAEKQQ
jgi:hypothetical protein